MIKQNRTYTAPAGHTNVITITDWAETLSNDEKRHFYQGYRYQESKLKTEAALGKLAVNDLGNGRFVYEWADEASMNSFVNDSIYESYHARYLSETGITLTILTDTL